MRGGRVHLHLLFWEQNPTNWTTSRFQFKIPFFFCPFKLVSGAIKDGGFKPEIKVFVFHFSVQTHTSSQDIDWSMFSPRILFVVVADWADWWILSSSYVQHAYLNIPAPVQRAAPSVLLKMNPPCQYVM